MLQFQLEQWGHQVVTARDGAQAWELFRANRCQVVISDWVMPRMTGIELVRRIRAAESAEYVYVIMLTTKLAGDALNAGLLAGADDFLAKPVEPIELRARLQPSERIVELERQLAERKRELRERTRQLAELHHQGRRELEVAARMLRAESLVDLRPHPAVRVAARHLACPGEAGDVLTVSTLDAERVALGLADISGQGLRSVLIAMDLGRELATRRGVADPVAPQAVLQTLERGFRERLAPDKFLTVVCGTLAPRTGELRYSLAGHPPPIVRRADGTTELLDGEGFPIGPYETHFSEQVAWLRPGDRLVLYSDGVPHRHDAQGISLGTDRLRKLIERNASPDIDAFVGEIVQRIQAWAGPSELADDLALIAIDLTLDQ